MNRSTVHCLLLVPAESSLQGLLATVRGAAVAAAFLAIATLWGCVAKVPMFSEVAAGEPSPIDGLWLDTGLQIQFYIRSERLWAAQPFVGGNFTWVKEGQVQAINLKRADPGRFAGWHPGWDVPYHLDLTDDGRLEVRTSMSGVPYRSVLIRIELDDAAAFERERRLLVGSAPEPEETVAAQLPDRPAPSGGLGGYHALLIGNNAYRYLNPLRSAHADVNAIDRLLRDRYAFETRVLFDATRSEILQALEGFRSSLAEADNLLVYYAGHGWLDEAADEGYWLPVDAQQKSTVNWISNATLTSSLKAIRARHVLVVADSCYSGKLTRGMRIVGPDGDDYLARMAQKRARIVLSSGGLEPVLDGGGGEHSVFAASFLGALGRNAGVLDTNALFSEVRRSVMLSAEQSPELADIRRAGHEGGDFFFVPSEN